MDEGPYRSSQAVMCPRCSVALLVGAADRPSPCPTGCGEWYTDAAFAEALSPALLRDPDPDRWWRRPPPTKCPCCAENLAPIRNKKDDVLLRCEAHGTWLDAGIRARLETAYQSELVLHRAARTLARELERGEPAALRAFARRFLELERTVAMLMAAR